MATNVLFTHFQHAKKSVDSGARAVWPAAANNNSPSRLPNHFQDGGPPGLDLKLDGEASDCRRPGEPTKGSRYIQFSFDKTALCISLALLRWWWGYESQEVCKNKTEESSSGAAIGSLSFQVNSASQPSTKPRRRRRQSPDCRRLLSLLL